MIQCKVKIKLNLEINDEHRVMAFLICFFFGQDVNFTFFVHKNFDFTDIFVLFEFYSGSYGIIA